MLVETQVRKVLCLLPAPCTLGSMQLCAVDGLIGSVFHSLHSVSHPSYRYFGQRVGCPRCEDFHVCKVDLDGNVVRLTSTEIPPSLGGAQPMPPEAEGLSDTDRANKAIETSHVLVGAEGADSMACPLRGTSPGEEGAVRRTKNSEPVLLPTSEDKD